MNHHDPEQIRQLVETVLGHPDSHNTAGDLDYWCPFCVRRGFGRQSHLHVNYKKGKALCVAGDQRVVTANGLVKISEVGVRMRHSSVSVLSHDFATGTDRFVKVAKFFANGRAEKSYLRIITDVSGRYGARVTDNHEMVTPDGRKVVASSLRPGDVVASRYYRFSPDQEQVALGTMLGDAHIAPVGRVMTFDHETDQAYYAEWKRSVFAASRSRTRAVADAWGPRESVQSCVSGAPVEFGRLRALFYQSGRKVVPQGVLDRLSPLGIAVWFMDAGCFRFDRSERVTRASLSVDSFDAESVARVARFFGAVGATCRVGRGNGKPTLLFTVAGTACLRRIIEPYVVPHHHHTAAVRMKRRTKLFKPYSVVRGAVSMGPATVVTVAESRLAPGHSAGNYRFCLEVPGTNNFYLGNGALVSNCHQCGGWKDLLHLVRALLGKVPRSLTRAKLGVELVDYVRDSYARARADLKDGDARVTVELPKEFIPLSSAVRDSIGRAVRRYLMEEREVTEMEIEEVGVGYATEGRFKGYAIFPVYVGGELVTYTSRRVLSVGSKAQHAPASKSHLAIFNYDVAAAMSARRVFVGEGPFDAWAFQRRADRYDAGVALLGKVLHDDQARLLDHLPCDELCVCLDDTEHDRTKWTAARLAKMTSKRVSYILLPEGSGDPHENRHRLPRFIDRRTDMDLMTGAVRLLLD